MEKVEDRLFSANLLALAGIAMLMMLGISTIFQKRRALTMTEATEGRSRLSRFGRWVAELLLVFVGVYAAFWLNNYQQHRQDAQRRDQILASLEQEFLKGIESGKIIGAKQERQAAEFRRALDAGEMPPLHPFVFTTDYSPGDIATLLQSGGVELLAVKTLMALRELESVIRWGLSDMQRYEKLSDALIVPNLDQDISFFYDPATKKLRKRFEIYPQALEATVKFAHDLERTKTELVKQIQTERQRNLNTPPHHVILIPQSREKNPISFLDRSSSSLIRDVSLRST